MAHVRKEVGFRVLCDFGLLFGDLDFLDRLMELVGRLAQAFGHRVEAGVNVLDLGRSGLAEAVVVEALHDRVHPFGEPPESSREPRAHEDERSKERGDPEEGQEMTHPHYLGERELAGMNAGLDDDEKRLSLDHRREGGTEGLW